MADDKYPPGVNSGTKNAPWNQDPIIDCDYCGKPLDNEPDHNQYEGEECPNEGLTLNQHYENQEADRAEMKMEEQRLERFEERNK